VAERQVEPPLHLRPGELDDVVESLVDRLLLHAVQAGHEVDVLASRQLADEATGEFDHWGDALVDAR